MQNMVPKLLLIAVVLALCGLSIGYKDLSLGKDLRGGVSLVYKVSIPEDSARDPQSVLTQTITVLKDRVNPTGVLDISMQPLGRDRIEVVMPLPDEKVRALAKTYQDELAALLKLSEIRSVEVDEALKRGAAVAEIGGDQASERGRKVAGLQEAYDARRDARAAYEAAVAADADASEIRPLQFAVAEAEIAFDDLYAEVLGLSLGEARVRRVLGLPTEPQDVKNPDGTTQLDAQGTAVKGPGPRETALDRIKSEYTHLAAKLDETVAAYDEYQRNRKGFDDPEDLIRLLRGAGVLEFRIAVRNSSPIGVEINDLREQLREVGPQNTSSPNARWFPINELKQWYQTPQQLVSLEADPVTYFAQSRDLVAGVYEGQHFLLLYTTRPKSITHGGDREWSITNTFESPDELGRPAVSFNLDASGAGLMGRLTGAHIGEPMAIVLDGQIYSAPTIQSQISASGQITGNYSQAEVAYLIRVLAAGSLQARLSPDPIAMNTLGPSIGEDNLKRGRGAFIIALSAVAVFMLVYYFFAGLVAVIALIANGIIIFGVMMGIDGTFTLPGLAGIVLTMGMAVDANVLIYERIREELFAGELDLRGAVRQGYGKALSTILDANITNLIVCLVLFRTATTEVKGFALTLTIGICATLFTALFVTRQIYFFYTDFFKIRKLPMLPTVFPSIHRALEPNIPWVSLRHIFLAVSLVAVIASVILVARRGEDMLSTEFRGGVAMTMRTAPVDEDQDGEPDSYLTDAKLEPVRVSLRHSGAPDAVEDRIHALGVAARESGATDNSTRVLRELENAAVLTAGETSTDADGNIIAESFQVKVSSPKGMDDEQTITETIVDAISDEFGRQLDVTLPVTFAGAGSDESDSYVFPITKDELGQNIRRPDATQRVSGFVGGAAIVLEDIDPPLTERDIARRIDRLRNQPDFVRYSARSVEVHGLTPADPADPRRGYTDAVVLVHDPFLSYVRMTDTEPWYTGVAEPEWRLVSTALQKRTSFEQMSTFSSAVADTLSAQAIVAVVLSLLGILVYIWVRFGSLRYSLAAVVALLHDVTIALGLLALTGLIGNTAIGTALLLEPFQIDLGIVAALLTIIGYSLNDTIVILDRVRENRGKLPLATAAIVDKSINQTVSRTLLTSATTLVAILIMYLEGGSGIRPFAFCLLAGLIVGTYSSVAVAAPMVVARGTQRGGGSAGRDVLEAAEVAESAPVGAV